MNADNVQEVVRRNHGTAIEMVIHCKLGENWSSTVGMCSSCILGLDPLNYYASVLCLSVCLLACLHPLGSPLGCRVPEERNPDLPQLACLFYGLLSTSPCTAALPSGAFSLPLSLLYSPVCSQRYRLFLMCKHTSLCTRARTTQCIFGENHSGQQVSTDAHPNNWKAGPFVFIRRWKPHVW